MNTTYVAISAMKLQVNMTLLIIFETAMRKDQPYQKVCKEFFVADFVFYSEFQITWCLFLTFCLSAKSAIVRPFKLNLLQYFHTILSFFLFFYSMKFGIFSKFCFLPLGVT